MKDILTFKTDEHSWLSNMTLVDVECNDYYVIIDGGSK